MAHYLKTDFFKGYKDLLDESGEKFNAEFSQWLANHKETFTDSEQEENPRKPRQFYRYTYKDYLHPAYLTEDVLHMHWQYWHENAANKAQPVVALTTQ